MGGQEILVELLAGTIAASLAAVALHFSYKLLDPTAPRASCGGEEEGDRARLGRPNIVTNQYEDIAATWRTRWKSAPRSTPSAGSARPSRAAGDHRRCSPRVAAAATCSGRSRGAVAPGTGNRQPRRSPRSAARVSSTFARPRCRARVRRRQQARRGTVGVERGEHRFIGEVDSFLGAQNSEHEANTSMKTEFMTRDGFQTNEHARVMVLAATNRPWEVDDAILRRLPRSFEVGLPDYAQRVDILSVILRSEPLAPGFLGPAPNAPVFQIARATERYSGSDLKELCKQAAYGPIRDLLRAEAAERRLTRRTIPTEEAFEDAAESFSRDPPARRVGARRRCGISMRCSGKSSTSAEAAAAAAHAEAGGASRGRARGRRVRRRSEPGVGDRGVRGGAGADEMAEAALSAVTPEMLAQMVAALGGLDPRRTAAAAPKPPRPAPPAEVTPDAREAHGAVHGRTPRRILRRGAPNAPAPPGGSGGGAGAAGGLD